MMPASEVPGILLPTWLCFVLLGVSLLLIAGFAFLAFYYRRRLLVTAMQAPAEPVRFNPTVWHPDRRADLESLVEELRGEQECLQRHYNVLLSRHKTLINEFQRIQQGTRVRHIQPNGSKVNA